MINSTIILKSVDSLDDVKLKTALIKKRHGQVWDGINLRSLLYRGIVTIKESSINNS